MPASPPIKYSTIVRADPERVFDALATAEGLDAWFTQGSKVDLRAGGSIHFRWSEWGPDRITTEDGGPILEVDRPRRLVFQWGRRPTTITVDISPHPSGSRVDLTETGYQLTPEDLEVQLDCAAGWGEALTLLKFHVEHGLRYEG